MKRIREILTKTQIILSLYLSNLLVSFTKLGSTNIDIKKEFVAKKLNSFVNKKNWYLPICETLQISKLILILKLVIFIRVRLSGCRLECTWGILEATTVRVEGSCTAADILSKIKFLILRKSNKQYGFKENSIKKIKINFEMTEEIKYLLRLA